MPSTSAHPPAAAPKQPSVPQPPREPDAVPSFDALLRHLRQEVVRVLQLPPDVRAKEEQSLISLANRAVSRYGSADKAAMPPPLKQIDAYTKNPNPTESLSLYLHTRRADLALDDGHMSDGDDRDGIGEPSPDRDSDEDAIGSEHPKSPSLGPTVSPAGAQRQLAARLPTPSPSSPRLTSGTAGNTTVSSPEPRSTVSAPPQHHADKKKSGDASNSVNHTFTGDERCTNCIMRNNPTCVVNSSRQRCDSCFIKRHRCSKVLTPPTRPSRETKSASAKGKGPGDTQADTNGESASARAPKRKRTTTEDDTKRTEAAKRPTRPTRPAAAAASAAASASASAPAQRPPAPKKPSMQNGNAAASSSGSGAQNLSLAALAASASRAPRAPTAPTPTQSRHQYYQEKLQVISGILGMVQTAVKELQDQVNADAAAGR